MMYRARRLPEFESGPKATVVSFVPFAIREFKPGLYPGLFEIPACLDHMPQCLIVGDSTHYVYVDHTRGYYRVPNPSHIIAKSIVNDYVISQLEVSEDAHPAIFWVPGEYAPERVAFDHSKKIRDLLAIQNNWFYKLVKLGDDDWERIRQHSVISDMQRYAARAIDPDNEAKRPWILTRPAEVEEVKTKMCTACASDLPDIAVVCRYCGFILDPEKYAKMTFAKPGSFDLSKILNRERNDA